MTERCLNTKRNKEWLTLSFDVLEPLAAMRVKTFCGHWSLGVLSTGHLSLVDSVSIILNVLFLIVIGANCLYKWRTLKHYRGDYTVQSSARYPGHGLRWVLTACAITTQVFQLAEGIIAATIATGVRLHLFLPHVVAVMVCAATLVFYDFVERYRLTGYLGALLLYWGTVGGVTAMRVTCLMRAELHVWHARMALTLLFLFFILLLFALDVYVAVQLVSRLCNNSNLLFNDYIISISIYMQTVKSINKVKRAFFRHDRRAATKFGTHVRIETRLAHT